MLPERFWSKVDKNGVEGFHFATGESLGPCWVWTASKMRNGYGQIVIRRKHRAAHRAAYEDAFGPVDRTLDIDHLCRNRACCNPTHLEAVTHRENMRRGDVGGHAQRRKTHCPQGHSYDDAYRYRGRDGSWRRECRACAREKYQRKMAARRGAA